MTGGPRRSLSQGENSYRCTYLCDASGGLRIADPLGVHYKKTKRQSDHEHERLRAKVCRSKRQTVVNPISRRSYASGTRDCVIESQAGMISAIRLRPN